MRPLLAFALLVSLGGAARAEDKGPLPEAAPEMVQVKSACQVCHTLQYLTLQRLTEPQWKKTVEKMVKFGAPVPPTEIAGLVAFLAVHLPPELADARPTRVAAPAGAVPTAAPKKAAK